MKLFHSLIFDSHCCSPKIGYNQNLVTQCKLEIFIPDNKVCVMFFLDFFTEKFYYDNVAKQVGNFWDIAYDLDVMSTDELDRLRCKALKFSNLMVCSHFPL